MDDYCEECHIEDHDICGTDPNCPCCQNTLWHMWYEE